MSEPLFFQERFDTPIGRMIVVTDAAQRVCAADWVDKEERMTELLRRYHGVTAVALSDAPRPSAVSHALQAYFEGDLRAIDGVEVANSTGTDFQRLIWRELRAIPLGETVSYGALAERIGRPTASRAVGLANGSNPISIIVPCHRVIGANAALTGYGGGIERKRWLLEHEGVALPQSRRRPRQMAIDL